MSIKSAIRKISPNPRLIVKSIIHPLRLARMLRDMFRYNRMNTRHDFHASLTKIYPCLKDWDEGAGSLGVYFWQDLWAARKIFQHKPSEHYDIGSRIDGFIAHVLSFMPVTMIDIRPLPQKVEGLSFTQADATNLDGIPDRSVISLSSLCAPEHFGLGRYGDPVDPEACFAAMRSMQRVLAEGGRLYIAVPVGDKSGVAFNAHRIFTPEIVADTLGELTLSDFAVISGENFREHVSFVDFHGMRNGTDYSGGIVGLFEFVRG